LVVVGVDWLMGGELSGAQRHADLMSPEAQSLRGSSQTAYEGLSASEAEAVTGSAFSGAVNEPDGGPPVLSEGESIVGFPSDYAASLVLGEGQHAVVESSAPMAAEGPDGSRVPLNLRPLAVGGGFEAVTPVAGSVVRTGGRLSEGVSLGGVGVSLTPVTRAGVALEASGVVDGASVFYGDSEDQQAGIVDLDSLVKLDAYGFREDSILRSERAPSTLYYKVGLPQGATLAQDGSGSVAVVVAGRPVAVITTGAQDAEGTTVGVSVSVVGDLLVVGVEHAVGQYRMPIMVDPNISEGQSMGRYQMGNNWEFAAESPKNAFTNYQPSYGVVGMEDHDPYGAEYANSEYGLFGYETAGQSRIYEFVSKSFNKHNSTITSTVYIAGKGGLESPVETAGSNTVCVVESCAGVIGGESNWGNGAFFKQAALTKEWGPFEALLESATVYVVQEKGPSVTSLGTCGSTWTKTGACNVELKATDPGLGVSEVIFSSPNSGEWGGKEKRCLTIQCTSPATSSEKLTGLPEGEDTVKGTVKDPVGLSASSERAVKIDNAPPHNLVLSGLGAGNQVGPGEYNLKAEATDGSEPTPSSGMSSITVWIDGREVGSSSASCSPGPCTGHSATWSIFGHNYATGRHTVTISATDNAGNTASEKVTMIVRQASPVGLGVGSVNSGSGELSLSASDVSLPGGLTVGRSYRSQHLTAGVGGPTGPQWGFSLGGEQSLIKQPDGSMVLIDGSGAQTIFSSNGSGGYVSPPGDSNLTLSTTPCEVGQTEFMLKNAAANTTTCFKVASGGSGEVWSPSIARGPVATDTVTYAFETVEVPSGSKNMVTRPTEALAPVPAGVSCSPEFKAGCRALTFNYASVTTAKGEALSEWGDYEGDLTRVYYTAWDPVSKTFKKPEVAHYMYDNHGRLRGVWDPRVTPELKTYYGYDSEGHLTAVTPPGRQTSAFVYGTMSGNTAMGVALKATQAPTNEKEEVWGGAIPVNTVAPEVTGPSTSGIRMAVTEGKWSGNPVVYGYQWEDCNGSGGECSMIGGATNANYTPTSKDEGHRLAAVVTATNGAGSISVTVLAPTGAPAYSGSFGSYGTGPGQLREAEGDVVVDGSGNVWVSDSGNSRLEEFNSKGEYVRTVGSSGEGSGQFRAPYGVAIDSKGNVWASDEGNNRIQEFNSEGTFIKMFGWGVSNGENKFQTCTSSCHPGIQGSGNGEFYFPDGITIDSKGDLFVADRGNKRVQEFTLEGVFLRTISQAEEKNGPFYVTTDSSGNLWVSYSWDNKIAEFDPEGKPIRTWGTAGTGTGQLNVPYGLTVGPEGNIWLGEYGNNRMQVFTVAGVYLFGFGSGGSGPGQFRASPQGIAFSGSTVYVLDGGVWWENSGNSRVQKWTMPPKEGEARPVQPGSTIEYGVPVSGSGAPHAMGMKEVEEGWAQKDLPAEATAVFPPDEPQGWPASDYKRATVYYRDAIQRTVNVATPTGGISTSEYNEQNDVTRSLSADNRAIAVKEEKPAEAAKLLDTQSQYNTEGTELLSTLGPRHTVKLTNSKEVQARNHTLYNYDEGAPSEGGPYRLVTKMTQGAQTETEGEGDIRTTVTSYAGQNNLGWKLRKPTSVTTDPKGLRLTRTTAYDETTGSITETGTPAANPTPHAPTYWGSFGSYGTGPGQLREAEGDVVVDGSGNVWVSDSGNSRLEEFNSKGEYVRTVGSSGEGSGQFRAPYGIAIDSKGNVWASDEGNNRIQEFNSEGTFIKMFGWGVSNGENKLQMCTSSCHPGIQGSGNGEFYFPDGITIDSKGNLFVADRGNKRVQEFSLEGLFLRSISQAEEKNGPFYVTTDSSGNLWVAYSWDNKIAEFDPEGKPIRTWGTAGSAAGQLNVPYGLTVGPEGDIWLGEYGNNRVQVFTQTGEYLYGFGSHGSGPGQFRAAPQGIAFSGSTVYVLDSGVWWENSGNSRIEKWAMPATGKAGMHITQTIYYTKEANTKYPGCGEHPEWANMPCQTQPAEQPGTSGLPNLPVTTVTYNMYGEPTKTVSTVGSDTRTTIMNYDEAGRPESTETTSTIGTSLPKVTDKYSKTTGLLIEQNTSTQSLKSEYNTLGQLTSYTDADGNIATYEYEKEKDYRLKKTSDGKGNQTYEYDATTGAVKELTDSTAGKFTASYDIEGNLASEGYPNAMSANYTINTANQLTNIQYVKTAHCAKTCPETWYSDTILPSIHGQWLTQQSELANQQTTQAYTYDEAGRLTQAADNTGGKNCVTRSYAYDEETNRLSLTTWNPGAAGACATESGEVQTHTYDPANRLTDTGTKYDSFGNTIELPANDAGGTTLTNAYYQDNQLASQTQATQTIGYQLDPAHRTREIVSTGKITATEIQHYTSSSSTPAWTGELSTNYTRNITGISGTLAATQHNNETPVLQLPNLHGDIIATAKDTETSIELASTITEASEYGVPATETPPKYSWLGAHELPTALPSGVMTMGARSYVPQLGRYLQTDPVSGGSANAYAYVYADPINTNDLNGERAGNGLSTWALKTASELSNQEAAAYETTLRKETERKTQEAAQTARAYTATQSGTPEGEEGSFEEEWGEEEGEYENIEWHHSSEQEVGHMEEGLLYQSLEGDVAPSTEAKLLAMCSAELREHDTVVPKGACVEYISLIGELEKFGGELIHGTKKVASKIVHHALAFIKRHIKKITSIVAGCDRTGAEGIVGGGIGGAVFAPFVGPETIPIGAVGGGIGGCIVGGFEGALGV
jgi:RHS repeat-associated protein